MRPIDAGSRHQSQLQGEGKPHAVLGDLRCAVLGDLRWSRGHTHIGTEAGTWREGASPHAPVISDPRCYEFLHPALI